MVQFQFFDPQIFSTETDGFLPDDPTVLIAGVDEVGRGCLFGPVVAAAIAVPIASLSELIALGVKDSKQLSSAKRQTLFPLIKSFLCFDSKIPAIFLYFHVQPILI